MAKRYNGHIKSNGMFSVREVSSLNGGLACLIIFVSAYLVLQWLATVLFPFIYQMAIGLLNYSS
ncbi:hypothetical protein [Streptococcus saliviloxodontae]|uniref:Uncharacterized protein n=1 Tax=Streptococcus saliviloxodontae TaxID=1349416 RepID=A0ABS2PNF3_9STRE|nr:hypothetical protein [Streptococcus saliviloxodontae]MBM7636631.1 hypothetical protein [Streptococcus saliviloxodontae]